ncbi:hydroxymethylbilane synthase, partial [candidate division KSB1 bacterium]
MPRIFRIGTRESRLALWQTDFVTRILKEVSPDTKIEIVHITTKGDKILDIPLDKIGDTGLFTKEIEQALLDEKIDLAVHSLKDLASEIPEGLILGAVPAREDFRDVLISRGAGSLEELPENAKILTGSLRRAAQLLNFRKDFRTENIRGNVETRLRKFSESDADGLIMASAGLKRLGLTDKISGYISEETMIPAVCQG